MSDRANSSRTARVGVLTPPGRGAVAVVRVWGRDAVAVVASAFRPRSGPGLAQTPVGRLRLGRMGAGLGDEVVAVVLDGAPPEVEVHCHGGPAPLALVVEALVAAGAEPGTPEAWVGRSGRSPISVAAEIDLAAAPTVRSAEILLEQAQGALEAEILLLRGLARPEPAAALEHLDGLLGRSAVGLRLVCGWRVVLAGRPNVGKSRLLNALAGYERAIVAPTPGTTRDVVTVRTALEGWPVELADTAGLRPTLDPIEATGVALARARQGAADLVLVVLDRSEPRTEADAAVLAAHPGALVVANKADLPAAWEDEPLGVLPISARTGEGLDLLMAALARRLVPEPPAPGAGVPFRAAQVIHLHRTRRLLAGGRIEAAARALDRLLSGESPPAPCDGPGPTQE
jgi:tRNA modification GTPase